jgi:hypothetical protein
MFMIAIPASAMAGLVSSMYLGDVLSFDQAGTVTPLFVVRLTARAGGRREGRGADQRGEGARAGIAQ